MRSVLSAFDISVPLRSTGGTNVDLLQALMLDKKWATVPSDVLTRWKEGSAAERQIPNSIERPMACLDVSRPWE